MRRSGNVKMAQASFFPVILSTSERGSMKLASAALKGLVGK